MVEWSKEDIGKIVGNCPICGRIVRLDKVFKDEIVLGCDRCSYTVERSAETTV